MKPQLLFSLLTLPLCPGTDLVFIQSAEATVYEWQEPGRSTWDAYSWGGTEPDSQSIARISNGGTALLTWGMSGTYDTLEVTAGNVEIEDARLSGTSLLFHGSAFNITEAAVVGSSAEWIHTGEISFYNAMVMVRSGGRLTTQDVARIGTRDAEGRVVVDNVGSLFSADGALYVHGGELYIGSGGRGTAGEAEIGNFESRESRVTVTGSGSRWEIGNHLKISSAYEYGSLAVRNGGFVSSGSLAVEGAIEDGETTLAIISDADSRLEVAGTISIGTTGYAHLKIENGATATSGSLSLGNDLYPDMPENRPNGALTITGSGSRFEVEEDIHLYAFPRSVSRITVEEGGQLIGRGNTTFSGGPSRLSIIGEGSSWQQEGLLTMNGGSVFVHAGGALSTNEVRMGQDSNAHVGLFGEGSRWDINGDLFIFNASIYVNDGAVINSNSVTFLHPIHYHGGFGFHIDGKDSQWIVAEDFEVIGSAYDGFLVISDEGLLRIDGTFSLERITNGQSVTQTLNIDGGYLALFGDQREYLDALITDGHFMIWTGSKWITATASDLEMTYYTADIDGDLLARFDTGYDDLGGYTVITTAAIPEPQSYLLLAPALGLVAWMQKRRAACNRQ